MLTVLGSPRRCCDGVTRRETLRAGALTALGGFGLPQLLKAEDAGQIREGQAKSVIVLFLLGGAATQDMFDLKPEAPAEVRSQFQPIATTVPGLQVCEHLPRTAQWMHKTALVRSVTHHAGCHNTLPTYTGYEVMVPDNTITKDSYPPSMGSVCEYLRVQNGGDRGGLPDYVYMPNYLGWGQGIKRAGPYGGFLGHRFDALTTECDPVMAPGAPQPSPGSPQAVHGLPRLPSSQPLDGITLDRLRSRRTLQVQFDDRQRGLESSAAIDNFDRNYQRAYDLLTSPDAKSAFDVEQESAEVRDATAFAVRACSLIGRRLVERQCGSSTSPGTCTGDRCRSTDAWDTHTNSFPILRDKQAAELVRPTPPCCRTWTSRNAGRAVVVAQARWDARRSSTATGDATTGPSCYSVLFAGGGIRGGRCTVLRIGRLCCRLAGEHVRHLRHDLSLPGDLAGVSRAGYDGEAAGNRPRGTAHRGDPGVNVAASLRDAGEAWIISVTSDCHSGTNRPHSEPPVHRRASPAFES